MTPEPYTAIVVRRALIGWTAYATTHTGHRTRTHWRPARWWAATTAARTL